MPQYARPTSDTTIETWTTQAGATVNLYTTIDETATSTADYVVARNWPYFETYETEMVLSGITDGGTDTNVQVHYQLNSGGPELATFHMWARQGSTYIDRWIETDVDNTSTDLSHTFSDAECALINYASPLIIGWKAVLQPTSLFAREIPPIPIIPDWWVDFSCGMPAVEISNFVVTVNRAYFVPILIPHTQDYDGLGIFVTTGIASSTAILALYDMRYDGQVGSRLYKTAALATATSSQQVVETFATALTLQSGWYYLAATFTHGVTIYGMNSAPDWTGSTAAFAHAAFPVVESQTDLTDPAPTLVSSSLATSFPRIGIRAV